MKLQTYLKNRRIFEVLMWIAFLLITFLANVLVTAMDLARAEASELLNEELVWESSSIVVICALIPLILKFDAWVPLRWGTFPKSTLFHLLFSVVFSLIHITAMVAIRKTVYSQTGGNYDFGNVPFGLAYEYLKDGRTYFLILGLIYLYRFILMRLQGEASLLQHEESNGYPENKDDNSATKEPKTLERLLVKKLGKEFLIQVKEIDYIEAAGNYVNIHIGERIYPLRNTMAKISEQLNEADFRRVHRSYLVNMNKIAEIQPLDSGDATIQLKSNAQIPMSRTYRSALAL